MVYKTLHRNLKIGQHDLHNNNYSINEWLYYNCTGQTYF